MNRVIYCPSDDLIEEASSLSKKNHLQIIVGDNAHTENLQFDRTKISVVHIPQDKGYFILNSVKKGFHQNIKYKNEFSILKDRITFMINDDKVKSLYEESHIAKFVYLCKEIGEYHCKIFIDGKIEEEFSFVVD
jgi:hypothetical protein